MRTALNAIAELLVIAYAVVGAWHFVADPFIRIVACVAVGVVAGRLWWRSWGSAVEKAS